MDVDYIRDLIYHEKNESLLQMYRSMSGSRELGCRVDSLAFDMVKNHLTREIPQWLLDGPYLEGTEEDHTYDVLKKILSKHPRLIELASHLYYSRNHEMLWLEHGAYFYTPGMLTLTIASNEGLLSKYEQVEVQFYQDLVIFDAVKGNIHIPFSRYDAKRDLFDERKDDYAFHDSKDHHSFLDSITEGSGFETSGREVYTP